MQVTQILFRLEERIYPDLARAMIARQLDGVQPSLVATVMNYQPGSEKTQTRFPIVQFAHCADGFSMIGVGDEGGAALDDISPFIHQAIARETKRIIQVQRRVIPLSAERRSYGIIYKVPRMVVQKKAGHLARLKEMETGKAHIEELFVRSLHRQAEVAGIELPHDLKAEYLGAEGGFGAKLSPDRKAARMGLRNATFEVNARLGGIWGVGYMLSKGYGGFDANLQLGMRESA